MGVGVETPNFPFWPVGDSLRTTEAVWKHKNFISILANESIDFLHFLASKIFPAKNDLPLQNGLSRPFET